MISEDFFKYNIGIIGAGHIGQALALKLRDIGFPTDNLKLSYNGSIFTFSDLYDNELVDNIADNSKIVDTSDIIIVSVPPQMFKKLGEFNLDDSTTVISFMAGVKTSDIKKQTGSSNVVRVIPTGSDTIRDSSAIAGVYNSCDIADCMFDLLGFDTFNVECEDDLNYMIIAGCLPAVFAKVDYDENIDDIKKFSENFPLFMDVAKKANDLVPSEGRDEFIKNTATKGGVTEAIIEALDGGMSLFDALNAGLDRNIELSKLE